MIIGTAGHVDHGKTTLVQALTGINTDRLSEEQARGLSIELGFAWIDLPSGVRAGIVDVPGHERFIHHMLAGATNLDLALLVIAADEGLRPQTREHLEILSLLEVQHGLVALTKVDLVEPDWLELIESDVAAGLRGTALEGARIVRVSSVTRQGLDELIAELDRVAQTVAARDAQAPFRLPVDRVFTMPGFGTVVTGTLAVGRVRVGDAAEILPAQRPARVRSVQVHGEPCDEAVAGSRVALNLAGLAVEDIPRGAVVAAPGAYRPTDRFDARVRAVARPPKPIRSGMRVHVHLGADDIPGRLHLLDARTLDGGASALAQIQLDRPGVATRGERFILRYHASVEAGRKSPPTLGGGAVLEPYAQPHRTKERGAAATRLAAAETASPAELVAQAAREAAGLQLDPATVAARWNLAEAEVAAAVAQLLADGGLVKPAGADWVADGARFADLCHRIKESVRAYHAAHPLRAGMPVEQARAAAAAALPPRVVQAAVAQLLAGGAVQRRGDRLALVDFQVQLTVQQQTTRAALERVFTAALFAPPALAEAIAPLGDGAAEVAQAMLDDGELHDLGEVIVHRRALDEAAAVAAHLLREHGTMSPAAFRDALGTTRKYVMPLLEYLDRRGVTRRDGAVRVPGPSL